MLGVNCTLGELPDISSDRVDVVRPSWDNKSVHYLVEIELDLSFLFYFWNIYFSGISAKLLDKTFNLRIEPSMKFSQ